MYRTDFAIDISFSNGWPRLCDEIYNDIMNIKDPMIINMGDWLKIKYNACVRRLNQGLRIYFKDDETRVRFILEWL